MIVSYFDNVNDNRPKEFELEEWLRMTINPPENLEKLVLNYRDTFDKKAKERIPCITVSASFNNIRNLENINQKNKLICLDVDRFSKSKKRKSNNCIDMLLVKELFISHPSTYYVGFSCGGDGVYAILLIDDENDLIGYFEYFRENLARIGINIDESCKDYTRLRFFSVDKEAYFNPDAKVFKRKKEELKPEQHRDGSVNVFKNRNEHRERIQEYDKVKKIIEKIQAHGIDVTSNYDDWYKIGGAFQNEFGEDGRSLFHAVSSKHPKYEYKACDLKYTQCKHVRSIKINTFYSICKDYGITYID